MFSKNPIEISKVHYSLNSRVIKAHIVLNVSYDSVAALDVYIGMDGKLRVDGFGEGAHGIPNLLQWVAFLAAHEYIITETIKIMAKND